MNNKPPKITKPHLLGIKLTNEEKLMIDTLKQHPHYVNIPQYIRDSIHHLYKSKMNKAGRP